MILAIKKMTMSIPEMVDLLIERADANTCDGEDCDRDPPHTGCDGCHATRALNEAAEILRKAI